MLLNEMKNEFGDNAVGVLVSKLEFYIWEVNNYITVFCTAFEPSSVVSKTSFNCPCG